MIQMKKIVSLREKTYDMWKMAYSCDEETLETLFGIVTEVIRNRIDKEIRLARKAKRTAFTKELFDAEADYEVEIYTYQKIKKILK